MKVVAMTTKDRQSKKGILEVVEIDLQAYDDPEIIIKFDKLYQKTFAIYKAKGNISRIFNFERDNSISLTDLIALLKEIEKEAKFLKVNSNRRYEFLVELYDKISAFLRYLNSEMELTGTTILEFHVPQELRQDLISYHARINKIIGKLYC